MSKNIYCDAKLFIDGDEMPYLEKVSIVFSGDSKLNHLNATFSIIDIEAYSLYNKKISFFLNESGPESVPYFTGYIMDVTPKETSCSIKALDPRCFLSGNSARKISLTDKNNYDGYTLVQFINDIVDETIGPNGFPKNALGTQLLEETSIPILLKNVREENTDVYSILNKTISESINDSNIETPKGYFLDIVETETNPCLVVKERQDKSEKAALFLSYIDGLVSLSYNKRAIPSYAIARASAEEAESPSNIIGIFQDGNMPLGYRSINVEGNYKDPDSAKYYAMLEVFRNKEDLEVKVIANKGFKTPLGSIIYLDVDDVKIRGNHILISKRCNWSESGVKLDLTLGRASPDLREFI